MSHILVVEDDDDIRNTLGELLQADRYAVKLAANGKEALDSLKEGPTPCLIFLDMMMPVMDGWAFLQERQRNQNLAAIPVITLTAVPGADKRAAAMGATGSLTKPVSLEIILSVAKKFYSQIR